MSDLVNILFHENSELFQIPPPDINFDCTALCPTSLVGLSNYTFCLEAVNLVNCSMSSISDFTCGDINGCLKSCSNNVTCYIESVAATLCPSIIQYYENLPTIPPTPSPSYNPTSLPTRRPTLSPSSYPTRTPLYPTKLPTSKPSAIPSYAPAFPTNQPSASPTPKTSSTPTNGK